MAQTWVAFTSLDGYEYACVCRSEEDEDRPAFVRRASETVSTIADGIDATMFNVLQRNLRVLSHYQASTGSYQPYLNTAFDLRWLQAQADKARLRRS